MSKIHFVKPAAIAALWVALAGIHFPAHAADAPKPPE